MGLSNGSGNYNSGPLYLLTPRIKNADGNKAKPHFTADTANEAGQLVRVDETYTRVAGDVFRAEVKTKKWNDGKKDRTSKDSVFYFRDPDAAYRLPLSSSRASRDLINRFATLLDSGDFTGLELDYYENKKGYDTYSLKQRGERVEWRYKLEELPPPIDILHPKTGEVEKRDYDDVDAFFEAIVIAIGDKLKEGRANQEAPAPAANEEAAAEEPEVTPALAPVAAPVRQPARVAPKPAAPKPVVAAKPATAAPARVVTPPARPAANVPARVSTPAARTAAPVARTAGATRTATVNRAPAPAAVAAGGENLDEDVPF